MRWTRGRRRERPAGDLAVTQRYWAGRLGAIGLALDETGITLRDLSISVAGEEAWLCGWAWFQARTRSGWSVMALRLDGDRLVLVDPAGRPLERAVGASARPPWAPRLRAIGLLLDRSGVQLIDPWLVEVGDGFVVTALTAMDAGRASRIPLSREFGAEDLEAALLAERAEHAGRQGRSARDGMT